ncbi:23S rRNA (guanosine(2251)-2'-O)-methyltransferase RlmB [Cellvibrio japonicus]|uniref:23S rRNA (guanosine-2'-O-)-methyltransferase RlmB n=1 Tax=Cellvibrio japonicus (strain Ueda107) TaxID=498211 RepID=B3PCT4_CELJU|nr:23S rRNA (guanosine(2251)-2'-O)-methyltransferase RlmB [Cellvibrio japonicus]ACE84513.1 RNA methyltransferase, TrmH family, group 3 [Cellvibrio japonicus Ueda107]QEI13303.1 23S rRNA (guanosine(2251)-2'-O)-methyltransferase RlmB [Cellvibrio japonicus]QEI16877.1 23S rRNA (guanosine(2251)-2'-O)-methyltransferase RlmB [Cellvibrio japonicus]QEI20455.1 23S rRNA (guanosine(2251)-2'-O)-methyltransferase RlmB [Cellvibrio japonicus]
MKYELVYGLHAVQALLKSAPQRVLEIYVLQGRQDQRLQKIAHAAELNQIHCNLVSRNKLDDMVSEENHQGVVARCTPGETYDEAYLFSLLETLDEPPFLLVLDGVTDPHNLGACMRSAEAAGVHAVIAPKDKSAGLTPVARKVACGAAEVLPFIPVTNLARTLKKLQEKGIWLFGAAGEASQSLYQTRLTGPIAILMGAEGDGLRRLTQETCDQLMHIPMAGSVSSLNVSVATGVCLFEAVRQRQVAPA